MEVFTFLTVLAILIILVINNTKLNTKLNLLLKEVELLKEKFKYEKTEIKPKEQPVTTEPKTDIVKPAEAVPKVEKPTLVEPKPVPVSSYQDTVRAKMEAMNASKTPSQALPPVIESLKPPKQPTDLEKFVGENLISKIGIIILVLGVGFFVKYAIDQNWIGVYGRTAIGLLTGGIMVSIAHYLRKSFKTFSSLLTGGGFAVFYLTIGIAFHQYSLFSQATAFILMVLITIFSVLLSLAYDKKELAVFSQFGGYAAPFMVSTGEGNYVVLFSYLLILNAGLLTLAYFKRWHILNLLAFIFTLIIFSGWLGNTFWGGTKLPYLNAMLFATAFYIVFFLANILNNLKERKPFKAVEIMMILSNNLFYFLWGIVILYSYEKGMYKGLFAVLAGLFNFGWVLYLYRKKQIDKNLIYLLIGLVMSYISLAIPIQLSGHSITLFWTAELVILLWLSQVSGIKILKTGHLIILSFVIISLMMDWGNLYNYYNKTLPIIFNQPFITGLFVIGGLVFTNFLLRKEKEETFVKNLLTTAAYRNILTFVLFAVAFVVPFLELIYQVTVHISVYSFRIVIVSIYVYAYIFSVLLITRNLERKNIQKALFIWSLLSLLLYFFIFHVNVLKLRTAYIFGNSTITPGNMLFHYLAIPFVAGIIALLSKKREAIFNTSIWSNAYSWFICFLLVFIASAELDNILLLILQASRIDYYQTLEMIHKVGYPILWGILAFGLITFGIKFKNKVLRVQALSLFALIIFKLFLFDVWSMSEGGIIAAFLFLGVILLVVSFLYQKLKNLLLDVNDTKNNVTV